MSGQQIGTAVGFVAGFFLPGGPQVWAAIGGMVGGAIDPTEIEGPRIGDGQNQSSAEGVPIAWIQGKAGFVQGNIVDKGPRREIRKEDDGKGSSTVAVTYEAHQDFTIMICESSETRDSLMVGVLIVRVNGKIVYDMRAESNFAAENAKFLENHTFYDGNEAQLTDPTEEAWPTNGVGNTPYYRGVYRMVARDINLSQYGDAIPTYEFVMVGAGIASIEEITTWVPPELSQFQNAEWPLVQDQSRYTFTGVRSGGSTFSANTIEEIIEHFADFYDGIHAPPDVFIGYSAGTNFTVSEFGINGFETQPDITDNFSLLLVYNQATATNYIGSSTAYCADIPWPGPDTQSDRYIDDSGSIFWKQTATAPGGGSTSWPGAGNSGYCTGDPPNGDGFFPAIQGWAPLVIKVERIGVPPAPVLGDPCLLGFPALLPDAPGFVINCEGDRFPTPVYAPGSGPNVLILQPQTLTVDPPRTLFETYPLGPVMEVSDPDNTQAVWEAHYDAAVSAGKMVAGLVWNVDYPVSVVASTVYTATSEVASLEATLVSRVTGISRICVRGGLLEDDLNLTEITGTFIGYPIKDSYDGASALRPLLFAWKAYGSEYDAKLNFHYHGADIEVVIDPDDIIDTGEVNDRDTRELATEYPRKIGVGYIDPDQNFEARPQWAYRLSNSINAIGEESTQTSVVMTAAEASQLADVSIKVAYARVQGFRELALPFVQYDVYLKLVPGMAAGLDQKRWIVSEMMMEEGELQLKLSYDRQSAFFSNVTGVPALPPTRPPSTISGVTLTAVMNLPALRDQDDRLGIYVAVCGLLPSWQGCLIQIRIGETGEWTTAVASATQSSTIGYLTKPLPLAPAYGNDVTNTLSVAVHGPAMNSISYTDFLNEGNPVVVMNSDGTGELMQFLDSDETSAGRYDLTTLVRGGLDTTPAEHSVGSRFVALNAPYFIELPISAIGQTIYVRPVSFGTLPDNNATYSIVWEPALSQTEFVPAFMEYSFGFGSSVSVSVVPRHRFGTDVTPVASVNFLGFRWTATDGDVTQTQETDPTTPNCVFDLADFGSPLTISCEQLNRFTGPGPSASITI